MGRRARGSRGQGGANARKNGRKKGAGRGDPRSRAAPARTAGSSLTTLNGDEHKLRVVEAELLARWSGLQRLCGRWRVRALLLLALAEERKQMRWRTGWQMQLGRCRRDRRGAGQAGGAARRAHRRMAATRRARSDAAGCVRGGRARRVGAGARHGGRPGRPMRLGRRRGAWPI